MRNIQIDMNICGACTHMGVLDLLVGCVIKKS